MKQVASQTYSSLLIVRTDVKVVFKHWIHDSPNSKRGFNHIGNDLLNMLHPFPSAHRNQVFGQLELLAINFQYVFPGNKTQSVFSMNY